MDRRCIRLVLVAALIVASGAGCRKSTPAPEPAAPEPTAPSAPAVETVARIHWLGKERLAAETNAAGLMTIWNLPESARLETQTLGKLSVAPWPLLHREADTNASALLRPLLDDALQEESYLEVRRATNQPGELAFAIRLPDARAGLWQTNLAAVLKSLTDIRPAPDTHGGWSLKKHHAPDFIQLARAGGWTILGAGQETNALFNEMRARIERDHAPFAAAATNYWLEAELDPRQLASAFSFDSKLPEGTPKISLTVAGDGANVRMRGELNFPRPLPVAALEPWNIPTNLVHNPLVSFMAVRGVRPWLASLKAWNDLQIGPPPDQFFLWAMQGLPNQTYFAAPLPDASNEVYRATDLVLQKGGPWFATNSLFKFERAQQFNGLDWKGLPYISPFLQSIETSGGGFAFGGFFPATATNPPPPALLEEILSHTNLVCYQWELTGPRIEAWIFIGQFLRFATGHAQLPFDSASLAWLKAVAPKLGNCATGVTHTGPAQLSFVRKSPAGFTALELHLLADWLESPQFPRGLYTLLAPAPQ